MAPFLDERVVVWSRRPRRLRGGLWGSRRSRWPPGLPRSTIGRGLKELAQDEPSGADPATGSWAQENNLQGPDAARGSRGAGRADDTRDPESPLRWTCRACAAWRRRCKRRVTRSVAPLVAHLLNEAGYSLQGNRKTTEGDSHPDRDAQFGYINTRDHGVGRTAAGDLRRHQEKELVGDFLQQRTRISPLRTRRKSVCMTS